MNTTANRQGILLIHGLLDSRFAMGDLEQHFLQQGYQVHSLLLPGHGTKPSDLHDVRYEDWQAAVETAIKQLRQQVKHVSIAGMSTGAALAILHSMLHRDIEKVYLFSPAIRIKNPLAALSGLVDKLGHLIPRFRWLVKLEEDDVMKYRSTPLNAAWQVYRLTQRIKHAKLNCPIFMAISAEDEVVSFDKARAFFLRQPHPDNQLLIYSSNGFKSADKRITTKNSYLPEQHIENYSHVSLLIAPDNPHYGQQGAYTHKEQTRYHSEVFGNVVLTSKNKAGKTMSRLYYNPQFNEMMHLLDAWNDKTSLS